MLVVSHPQPTPLPELLTPTASCLLGISTWLMHGRLKFNTFKTRLLISWTPAPPQLVHLPHPAPAASHLPCCSSHSPDIILMPLLASHQHLVRYEALPVFHPRHTPNPSVPVISGPPIWTTAGASSPVSCCTSPLAILQGSLANLL